MLTGVGIVVLTGLALFRMVSFMIGVFVFRCVRLHGVMFGRVMFAVRVYLFLCVVVLAGVFCIVPVVVMAVVDPSLGPTHRGGQRKEGQQHADRDDDRFATRPVVAMTVFGGVLFRADA